MPETATELKKDPMEVSPQGELKEADPNLNSVINKLQNRLWGT